MKLIYVLNVTEKIRKTKISNEGVMHENGNLEMTKNVKTKSPKKETGPTTDL